MAYVSEPTADKICCLLQRLDKKTFLSQHVRDAAL